MRLFWTALRFLTVFPWPKSLTSTPEEIGKSAALFPLVGFCLGLVLVFFSRLLHPYLDSTFLGITLVALMILLTRAFHLDGVGDTFDGLGAGGGPQEALRAMDDSRVGVFGLVAVVVVLAFKFHALAVLGDWRGLLLAPVLGRWAMVVLAYDSKAAHAGLGQIMVENVRGWHLFWATLLTLVLIVIFAPRVGLWSALWVSLLTLLSKNYLRRRLGGVTGDTFGAVGELSETLALVIFASV
jgi:adenosylcobinamide-GDP ribazoletransferase